jgi:hypothetical protein
MAFRIRRIDAAHLGAIMAQLGITNPVTDQRLDAGETASLARQLEFVEKTIYETKVVPAKSALFIPYNATISDAADSWSYSMWNGFGMAKIIHGYADDLPMVGRFATKYTAPIRSMGNAFGYSIQDIRAAAFAGVPLEGALGMQARRVIEMFTDELLSVGSADNGLEGFVNNANIPDVALPNGSWASATSAQILEDLHYFVDSVRVQSKQNYEADTLLFDTVSWGIVTSKPYSDTIPDTILTVFMRQKPTLKNADVWWRLDTAAGGSAPALITYARTPEVVEGIVPLPFAMLPPQPRNLGFVVPCEGRCGGSALRYPIGAAKTDDQ